MSFFKSNKKAIISLTVLVIVFSFLAFNEYGLVKYFKLKSELSSLNTEIERIEKENIQLRNEIDSLQKKIPAKIEKLAREKYKMKRKGEVTIQIRQK